MPHATVCDRHKVLMLDGETCPTCVADRDARKRTKQRAHGTDTPAWRRRSRAKLRRDPRCELEVDERCTGRATTVHIPPEYRGNHAAVPDDELVSACRHCHGVVDGPRAHAGARRA